MNSARFLCSCKICGKIFESVRSVLEKGRGNYCSRSCANVVLNKSRANPKVLKNCEVCGTEMALYKSTADSRFCSRKCQSTSHSKYISGNTNPAWMGGVTPAVMRLRGNRNTAEWRKNVFTRDGFSCQECGVIGGQLEAHHIRKFSVLIQEVREKFPGDDLYDAAVRYEPLWDIGNGVTLCEKCHSKHPRR